MTEELGGELRDLVREVMQHRERREVAGKQLSWPEGIRRRAVTLLGKGKSTCKLSSATGISTSVFCKWQKKLSMGNKGSAGFSELRVVTAEKECVSQTPRFSAHDIVLIGRQGNRVVGLCIEQIAEFLQAGVL